MSDKTKHYSEVYSYSSEEVFNEKTISTDWEKLKVICPACKKHTRPFADGRVHGGKFPVTMDSSGSEWIEGEDWYKQPFAVWYVSRHNQKCNSSFKFKTFDPQ